MAGKRDRILELKNYIEQFGIDVNIGKNKARGHKGFFASRNDLCRIDISKNQDDESALSTLIHEYVHFIHYKYDKSFKSLDFIFPNLSPEMQEELIKVSVEYVPKDYAKEIYSQKDEVEEDINHLVSKIKTVFPAFRQTLPLRELENGIKFPANYLLKYDRVKFSGQIYTIDSFKNSGAGQVQVDYINLKSKQRKLRRINSRITRLNNYYNKPAELFSRFMEMYCLNYTKAKAIAPICTEVLDKNIDSEIIPEFKKLKQIVTY